jgi:hypothetical protein
MVKDLTLTFYPYTAMNTLGYSECRSEWRCREENFVFNPGSEKEPGYMSVFNSIVGWKKNN